jgi:hypothetical protein
MKHSCFKHIVLVGISVSIVLGNEPISHPYIAFPQPFEKSIFHYSLGATITLLPRQIVEEEIRQIPMINITARYGLPKNFSLTTQIATVYITNVISVGVLWSYPFNNISIGISDEFSYWFGFADLDGFDTKAMGLFNKPGISAGINIDENKITVKSELLIMVSQHTYFGSASVGRVKPKLVGITTTLFLEQDLWKSTYMSFALKANYAIPNYQVWLAFSVQDRWLLFPELQISFLF